MPERDPNTGRVLPPGLTVATKTSGQKIVIKQGATVRTNAQAAAQIEPQARAHVKQIFGSGVKITAVEVGIKKRGA